MPGVSPGRPESLQAWHFCPVTTVVNQLLMIPLTILQGMGIHTQVGTRQIRVAALYCVCDISQAVVPLQANLLVCKTRSHPIMLRTRVSESAAITLCIPGPGCITFFFLEEILRVELLGQNYEFINAMYPMSLKTSVVTTHFHVGPFWTVGLAEETLSYPDLAFLQALEAKVLM